MTAPAELLRETIEKRAALEGELAAIGKKILELRDKLVQGEGAGLVALEILRLRKLRESYRGQINLYAKAIRHLSKEATR